MAALEFNYDLERIREAERDFRKVNYEGTQRKFVEEAADILAEKIQINPLALKGFILRAVKKWQIEKGKPISDIAEGTPGERINAVREIMEQLRIILQGILKDESSRIKLNEAMKEGMSVYLKKYAGRNN